MTQKGKIISNSLPVNLHTMNLITEDLDCETQSKEKIHIGRDRILFVFHKEVKTYNYLQSMGTGNQTIFKKSTTTKRYEICTSERPPPLFSMFKLYHNYSTQLQTEAHEKVCASPKRHQHLSSQISYYIYMQKRKISSSLQTTTQMLLAPLQNISYHRVFAY